MDKYKEKIEHLRKFENFLTHLKIKNKKGEIVPFELNQVQKRIRERVREAQEEKKLLRFIVLKARQEGVSTYFEAEIFHRTTFWKNVKAQIIGHLADSANNLFSMTNRYYDNLPKPLQAIKEYSNEKKLSFKKLKSEILVGSAEGGSKVKRSDTLQLLHCLGGSSLVILADGSSKKIKDIKVGDEVICGNGDRARVSKLYYQGVQNTYRLQTWLSNEPITLTANHKVLTESGYKRLDELTLDDYIKLPAINFTNNIENISYKHPHKVRSQGGGSKTLEKIILKIDYDFGYVIGYYLAEGHIKKQNKNNAYCHISFTSHKNEDYASRASSFLEPYSTSINTKISGNRKITTVYGTALATFFNDLCGRTDKKHLPDFIFDTNIEFAKGILSGFFSGDGSKKQHLVNGLYKTKRTTGVNVNEKVMRQLKRLAIGVGFGVPSLRKSVNMARYNKPTRDRYDLTFCGEEAEKVLSAFNVHQEGNYKTHIAKHRDNAVKIRSIEYYGSENVYDIEVDHPEHNFETTIGVVSNCTEVAFWRDAKETMLALLQTVPDELNTMIVIESTANGVGGWFYDTWKAATAGENDYIPIFLSWFDLPEYSKSFDDDEEKQNLINSLSNYEKELIKKYNLTHEQINWYRYTLKNKCDNDHDTMKQEYPSCVVAETRVGTDQGLIRIVNASEAKYATLGEIVKSHKQPISPIFKLITKDGFQLRGTTDHPIFLSNGETKDLSKLNCGEKIKLQSPRLADNYYNVEWLNFGVRHSLTMDEKWGRLLGYFMGDGSLHRDTLSFVCDSKDIDVIEDVKMLISSIFDIEPQQRIVGAKKGGIEVRASNTKFKPLFDSLGLLYRNDGGRGSIKRLIHVPEFIFRSPKKVVIEFLRGLFEADGFNDYQSPRVVLFSKKAEFLRDVQLLLLACGVRSRLNSSKRKNGSGYEYIANELIITGYRAIAFQENVGFISKRKIAKIYYPKDTKALKNEFVDEVLSVEPSGNEHTYNLTIEKEEAFDANGILTHNTPEEAFITSGRPVFDTQICFENYNNAKEPLKRGDLVYKYDDSGKIDGVEFVENSKGYIKLFDEIEVGTNEYNVFAAGCDVAEGLEQGDYSYMKVLDRRTRKAVLTWHGHIDADLLAEEQHKIQLFLKGKIYFCTEFNNHGLTTISQAFRLRVNQYYRQDWNSGYEAQKSELGFKTSEQTKKFVIDDLNQQIREKLFTSDEKEFWSETLTFVKNEKGRMQAQNKDKDLSVKCFDDRVMGGALMIRCDKWMPAYRIEKEDNMPDFLKEILKESKSKTEKGFMGI